MSKQKPTKWNWNPRRLKAAELMAVGKMTHEEIAKECSVNRSTVSEWNMHPEFKEKVMDLILLDERATKAGILKRAFNTLEKKSENAGDDKTTELDYLKFIADLMGHTKQTIKHEGNAGVNVVFYLPGNNRDEKVVDITDNH
jgi:predicted transcriptional regulator